MEKIDRRTENNFNALKNIGISNTSKNLMVE